MRWLQAGQWVSQLEGLAEAWRGQGEIAESTAKAMQLIEEWLSDASV